MLKRSLWTAVLVLTVGLVVSEAREGVATELSVEENGPAGPVTTQLTAGPVTTQLTAEPIALETGEMGCRITVQAKNGSRSDVWLMSENSRVRARFKVLGTYKWGTWKKMPMSNRRIRPGETASMTAELTFNCNVNRQYEFQLKRGTNTAWKKYGGSSGSPRTSLSLGDVATLF